MTNHLFCFGFGYSAQSLGALLRPAGWRISGTARTAQSAEKLEAQGHKAWIFDGGEPVPAAAFETVTHILSSVGPNSDGDPVLLAHQSLLAELAGQITWAGYLSTTGVYGDRGGEWVDETSPLAPSTERGERRLQAETAWLELFNRHKLPVHLFRLAGIYGPGRNQIKNLHQGKARMIIKKGQIFSRIHRDDIGGILAASIDNPRPGAAYNLCDDLPAPPQEVTAYAAELIGLPPPPAIAFEDAELSPMARSFYAESKRVSNELVKRELGYQFKYPDYKTGLSSLIGEGA